VNFGTGTGLKGKWLLPLLAVAALSGCSEQQQQPDITADLVLENGRFYTVDARRSWAEAVAVTNGRLVFVGTDEDVAALKGPSTQVIDLDGRMVLPGLFDVHIHALASGMEKLQCDLSSERMVEEFGALPDDLLADYLARIERCAADRPDSPWVVGYGWVMDAFGPGALASRELLDAIVPDRPVYMESADGHSAWVNSRALELAGITAATPDPAGGRIDREPGSLEPLGSLQEHAADLIEKLIPAPDLETRLAGLRYAVGMLNTYGITSIQDAKTYRDYLEGYRALDDLGELTLRVVASNVWDTSRGIEQLAEIRKDRDRFTHGNLRATSAKIWVDGVMENYTAAMLDPYLVDGSSNGMLMMTETDLDAAVQALDEAGFQVHIHAIGDRAVRASLDAFEAALEANGANGNRHHIAHAQVIQPDDIPRFSELGVAANLTPYWAYADPYITELTLPFLRPELARWLYPIGSLVRGGAVVVSGSDWAVSSANPFLQIETAVSRKDPLNPEDREFIPEERISLPEAIAMLTIDAAWVNHSEADTGSIEVGKYADLAILDRNLFDIAVDAISDTQVVMTLFDGRIVYEAGAGR
jgi:predicted amidohydrolase YtcJ